MLSRVAENLYWMARYLERAENTARLINSTTQVLLDLPKGASFGWDVLLSAVGLDDLYNQFYDKANEQDIMHFLIQDERNPSSIAASVRHARENTRTFREVLPMEIWERINGLHLYTRDNAQRATSSRSRRYEVLAGVIERRQSVIGLLVGSMSHDLAYQFIKMGLNLERADMTTRLLDVNYAVKLPKDKAGAETARERLWMGSLQGLSAYQMYRQHVGMHVQGEDVVRYLLTDPHFPRSVMHCIGEIENCLTSLIDYQPPLNAARVIWQKLHQLELNAPNGQGYRDILDGIQVDIGDLHNAISRQYYYRHQVAKIAEAPAAA